MNTKYIVDYVFLLLGLIGYLGAIILDIYSPDVGLIILVLFSLVGRIFGNLKNKGGTKQKVIYYIILFYVVISSVINLVK